MVQSRYKWHFYNGLNNQIKNPLCNNDCPENIKEFCSLVAHIDNHYLEFRQELQSNQHDNSTRHYARNKNFQELNPNETSGNDIVIGAFQGPISSAEHENYF